MVTRSVKTMCVSSAALLVWGGPLPAAAQFGIPPNRRKGAAASFEELNKLAAERMKVEQQQMGGGAGGALAALGDIDLGSLMKDIDPDMLQELMQEGMKDPQMQEMLSGMQGAMDELLNMDSDQLKAQMEEAMSMLTSLDMEKNILGQQEEVLSLMQAQGTASPEEIAEFRDNPEKFQAEIANAMGKMRELFNDPEALDGVVKMMKGFKEIINDPDAAMSKLGGVLQDALADDAKIEEARLQMLNDPGVLENSAMADLFGSEDMQDVLKDPEKWKKSVKEGQRMLTGDKHETGEDTPEKVGGVGMGEL